MREDCLTVEFEIQGDDCPLAEATRATGTKVEALPPQLRYDGNVLLQFSAPADEDLAAVLDADDRLRYLHVATGGPRDTFRCLSKHPCVVHELVSTGCIVESLTYEAGRARVDGAVVGRDVLAMVMERAGETVGVTLRQVSVLEREAEPSPGQGADLTPKQEACLRAAVEMGYFEIPRAADASDVAEALGISKSAFLERLRRAQRTLFERLYAPLNGD